MIENLSKNLWLLLTLALPGFFTYGLWRLLLFFVQNPPLSPEDLKQIDASALTTTCIIFAFALLQQAIAVAIEFFLYLAGKKKKRTKFNTLFCERFDLAAEGKLNPTAERTVGNFFLSFNMSVGIILIIGYFLIIVDFKDKQEAFTILSGLILLLCATIITTVFRMITAEKVITKCKNNPVPAPTSQSQELN